MKRILILEGTSKLGGAQFDNILIQKSKTKKLEYSTIVPGEGLLSEMIKENNWNIKHLDISISTSSSSYKGGKPRTNYLNLIKIVLNVLTKKKILNNYIKINKPDLIVSNGIIPHLIGGLVAKKNNLPIVFRLMDVIREDLIFGMGRKLFQLFCQYTKAKIVVPSKSVADLNFKKKFIQSNVEIIYNATDFSSVNVNKNFRSEYNIPEDKLIFGCYSRLTPWKGQYHFIESAVEILKKYDVYFLIVGGSVFDKDDFQIKLEKLVKKHNVQNNIIFTGFIKDMESAINCSDVVVVPSILPDPCPRVMVEAMSLSKPIIGSNLGGIPEVVVNNYNGLIYNSGNIQELKEALKFFIENPNHIKIMGANGKNLELSKYRLEDYQNKHETFFIKAINDKKN